MRILAIVPARGGSKGIPRKNVADLCGHPLITYTARAVVGLRDKGMISMGIISTNDQEVAALAIETGLDVPFVRPEELSGDNAKTEGAIRHALTFFKSQGEFFDAVLLAQPTSPLRTQEDLEAAVALFEQSSCQSLISVYEAPEINDMILYKMNEGLGVPLSTAHNSGGRRQDKKPCYVRNGAVYITSTAYFESTGNIISDTPLLYVMPRERSLNIDEPEDLEKARKTLCR